MRKLLLLSSRRGAVPPAAAWDASAKNAHVTLSNGNLTATPDGTTGLHFAGRATGVISSGDKKYWEITVNAMDVAHTVGIGVANASETFGDDAYLGSQANGLGFYDTDGQTYSNALLVATLSAYGTGSVVCVACQGGSQIFFAVNGTPNTGSGGIDISSMGALYPAYDVRTTGKVTANFGGSSFAFTPPVGFTGF